MKIYLNSVVSSNDTLHCASMREWDETLKAVIPWELREWKKEKAHLEIQGNLIKAIPEEGSFLISRQMFISCDAGYFKYIYGTPEYNLAMKCLNGIMSCRLNRIRHYVAGVTDEL